MVSIPLILFSNQIHITGLICLTVSLICAVYFAVHLWHYLMLRAFLQTENGSDRKSFLIKITPLVKLQMISIKEVWEKHFAIIKETVDRPFKNK